MLKIKRSLLSSSTTGNDANDLQDFAARRPLHDAFVARYSPLPSPDSTPSSSIDHMIIVVVAIVSFLDCNVSRTS